MKFFIWDSPFKCNLDVHKMSFEIPFSISGGFGGAAPDRAHVRNFFFSLVRFFLFVAQQKERKRKQKKEKLRTRERSGDIP
jgi:hypothetical protein